MLVSCGNRSHDRCASGMVTTTAPIGQSNVKPNGCQNVHVLSTDTTKLRSSLALVKSWRKFCHSDRASTKSEAFLPIKWSTILYVECAESKARFFVLREKKSHSEHHYSFLTNIKKRNKSALTHRETWII
ncbi:hypothetical protein EVAR_96450_1 [Eumeta japonica]|uniref:Uncharacterized protein n=1 Tax=Eumeta variegata TaxID=151549 RepID=A0A4C1VW24_EUMVA|nr:hypothetical protein EVAR_96450_1 [Eumeta japonica]